MPRENLTQLAFNRGLIAAIALARVDLKRAALSAEIQNNWMPRALGSMMLRPGLQYFGVTEGNLASRNIVFIKRKTDTAVMEFTNEVMRIWVNDALVTRASVSSATANGDFDLNLNSWTDNDEAGCTSVWVAGGYMGLTGSGTAAAIRDQTVTVAAASQNVAHALRIIIQRGPVVLRVGSTSGGDEYINEVTLGTGAHSLAFTPTGDFYIRFMSRLERQVLVDSCNVEAAGALSLPTPWATADLSLIRADPYTSQSADVVYVACAGYTQRKIERRDNNSWSIVLYQPDDGPFRNLNVNEAITITPSALVGNITLTASTSLFRSTHAPSADNGGALFRLTSQGQQVTQTATAQNTFTDAIEVTGVDNARVFTYALSGLTATGSTVTLQRSFDSATGPWTDVTTYTTDATATYDDALDNQLAWYRIGVKTGGYAAGTIVMTLTYSQGSIDGVARVTAYTSATVVQAEVVKDFGGTAATTDWSEGAWSDLRGWPTSVAINESRMCWAGNDKTQQSAIDDYEDFDDTVEGDSGPIQRSIGSGPVATINWLLPLNRLMMGGDCAEYSCRSNAFDEPLTPTNFNIKTPSGQGSAAVQPVKLDAKGMFVQGGASRLYELAYDPQISDYNASDLTLMNPDVCEPQIVRIGIQRQPDTRIHCVLSDGTAAVMVYDKAENILCWVTVSTDGLIEDVYVKPATAGGIEDRVYYVVARTINGSTVRHHEKWALESECVGGTVNKQADAFATFTNSPASATITGATHLVGETVVVWFDGKCEEDAEGDPQTYVVSASGTITLGQTATTGVYGLAYESRFKSAKLGQTLNRMKRVDHVGFVLANTHALGIKVGPDFDTMDYLPLTYRGTAVSRDRVYTEYDEEGQEFPGGWDPDARVCLLGQAPRPANVMAMTIDGETYG